MSRVRFAIVGAGRRARDFCRLAAKLPDELEAVSVYARDPEKREAFAREWDLATVDSLEQLADLKPDFALVSVLRAVAPGIIKQLFDLRIPVLSETPPAADVEGLAWLYEQTEGGRLVQVSEQFHRFPMHAARIMVVESGVLGDVLEAQVSVGHAYHGISVMRKLLGIHFEPATITARFFREVTEEGKGEPVVGRQTLAYFDFGDKLGIHDFSSTQYHTPIRASRVLVRGNRGEICGTTVRYLDKDLRPVVRELIRHDSGNCEHLSDADGNAVTSETSRAAFTCVEGCLHEGVTFGEQWVYKNPFPSACLSDDEIAVAQGLRKMAEHAQGGPSFYSLAEASQDQYLNLSMIQAAETGLPVSTEPQVWSSL